MNKLGFHRRQNQEKGCNKGQNQPKYTAGMQKTSKEQTNFKLQNPGMVAYTYNPNYKAEAKTLTCM